MRFSARALLLTWLIVGTMDITSAVIITLAHGGTILRLMQFIASGLLGRRAFQGGWSIGALGLVLHYFIAFSVVAVFYLLGRRVAWVRDHAAWAGMIYGLVVFAVMNVVVLPLSAATPRHSLTGDLIQIGIHIFVIGLPTALLLRHFSRSNQNNFS